MEGNKFYAIAVVVCPVDGEILMNETYASPEKKPLCNICGREVTRKKTMINVDTPYEGWGKYYEVVTNEVGEAFKEINAYEDDRGLLELTDDQYAFEPGSILVV